MTGLDGTPMPSFADNIKPDEAWDLVFYLADVNAAEEQGKRDCQTARPEAGRSECPAGSNRRSIDKVDM